MKKLILIFSICTFAWLGLTGCGDDKCTVCPGDPPPVENEYHFLYNFVGDFYHSAVLTYSTKTGKVVDSTYYGRFPFSDAKFTHDGKYVCYTVQEIDRASTWVTAYATGDTIAILDGIGGGWLAISHDDQYLLLSVTSGGKLLRIPSLEVVFEATQSSSWLGIGAHPHKNVAAVPLASADSLLIIDFREEAIMKRQVPLFFNNGEEMGASSVAYLLDGSKLVLTGGKSGYGVYQIRDAESFEILQEYSAPARVGPYLHPDVERVFFFEPWRDLGGIPSSVWELNLHTGLLRKILDGLDYVGTQPYFFGLNPSDMDITPDGKYAFLISGGEGMEHGPILKLDLDTYQIVDAFYPPGGVARSIRMYPVEIIN